MQCRLCDKKAIQDGLCRNHYIEEKEKVFLDNTDINNLGIVKWLKSFYPEHYRNETPSSHKEVYLELIRLYDPRFKNKQHRLDELIAPRGFGKSKIIFGIISYILAHNGKDVVFKASDGKLIKTVIKENTIVIFSETGGMAEDFVVNIRDEFSVNSRLKWFYHYTIRDAKEEDTGQWTRRAFKLNNCYIIGLGAGMQARGKIKGAYRPTFVFFDDIYSENNVKTSESRAKVQRWFDNSALNSIDDLLGKVLLVGTIVHEDTVLVKAEQSDTWNTLKYYPMDIVEFYKLVEKHLEVDIDINKCLLPYDKEFIEGKIDKFEKIAKQEEYFNSLQKDYKLLWPERLGLYTLVLKYKESVEKQAIAGFYQEYFHQIIPEELRRFKKEYFQKIEDFKVFNEFGISWFLKKEWSEDPIPIRIGIGVDIAGMSEKGDDSVISVAGMLPNGRIIVLEQSGGKFSMRDVISKDNPDFLRIDKVLVKTDMVVKKGYIDETFRLTLKWRPEFIAIGSGGGSEPTIINEFTRVFRANMLMISIFPRMQTVRDGKKEERIKNELLPYYETMSVFHVDGLNLLEHQLEYLGKTKHDDYPDSLEVCVVNLSRPEDYHYSLFLFNRNVNGVEQGEEEDYDWRVS